MRHPNPSAMAEVPSFLSRPFCDKRSKAGKDSSQGIDKQAETQYTPYFIEIFNQSRT